MFYTVYKTTNKINNKYYIGKHQTKKLDDGYMGSGKLIKRAIKKYGIENFTKEILHVFDTEEEMNAKEAELVLICPESYNLTFGGKGGFRYINDNKLNGFYNKEVAKNARLITNKKLLEKYGPDWNKIISKMGGNATKNKEIWLNKYNTDENFREVIKNNLSKGSNAALSNTSKEKRKKTLKKICHQQGSKNSNYGSCWITNGSKNKMIKKELLDNLENGWYKGRVIKFFIV